jgi:signal transduction histidine kinase
MPVDIGNVLHVLAHELRTPAGIAQGYLRMLMDDRLTDPADRRKAIEQAQKAIARVSELATEGSQLASWVDQPPESPRTRIDARALLDRVVANASDGVTLAARVDVAPAAEDVATIDAEALTSALVAVTKATARELRNKPCTIAARVAAAAVIEMWIGLEDQFVALDAGPAAPDARPLALERGGVGLSLVYAAAVLEKHGATAWMINGSRTIVGIRLPIEERAHP